MADIGKQSRPAGYGAMNKRTILVHDGRIVHTAEGHILQKWEGKDLEKSKPGQPHFITIVDQKFKIHEITDTSQNYNLTRQIDLKRPTKQELKDISANINPL